MKLYAEGTRAFQDICRGGAYREVCEAHATMKQELRERSEKLPPLTHTQPENRYLLHFHPSLS